MYFKLCGDVPNNYVAFKSKNYVCNVIASLFLVQYNKHLDRTKYFQQNTGFKK